MSENNCVENLSIQLDNIQTIYNGYLSDTKDYGSIVNLCIAIFDYIEFHFITPSGFQIINMDVRGQLQICQDHSASDLERSRSAFRVSLFLTICFNTFNAFIGLLYTAEAVPYEDLRKSLKPNDPKREVIERIIKLHEIKDHTNISFIDLHSDLIDILPQIEKVLKHILESFDESTSILYNQEKRRVFKAEIFGSPVLELPETDELKDMKAKCNYSVESN